MHALLAAVLLITPNLDDDDRDGRPDFDAPTASHDDDVVFLEGLPAGTELRVIGDVAAVRVRAAGAIVAGGDALPWRVDPALEPLELDMGAFGAHAELRFTDSTGMLVLSQRIASAPLVLPHPLLPVTSVHVVALTPELDGAENAAFVRALRTWSPAPVLVRSTDSVRGRWLQDEYELGYATGHWSSIEVVLAHGPTRIGGQDRWTDLTLGPGRAVLGADWPWESNGDGYGNIEVTPPLPGHPDGRILVGRASDGMPGEPLLSLLGEQRAQALTPIDTGWLCVGHVDEVVGFVPDATAPRGFRALVPDVVAGWTLLEALDPSTTLPLHGARARDGQIRPRATVADILGDTELRRLNLGIATTHLPALRAELVAAGIRQDEMLGLPLLYDDWADGSDAACGASPLWPNPVNLLAVHDADRSVAFLADPRVRAGGAKVAEDPVAQAVARELPASLRLVWLDSWGAYHVHGGDVHCATNVRRTPPPAR